MSAIAGVLRLDGEVADFGWVDRLTSAMAMRGPHGRSHWSDGPIALGHALLRNTPEAAKEDQPLASGDQRYRLVWDGRLDNREDLLAALRDRRDMHPGRSDPELVLAAYQQWADACVDRLLGDFAFAVWDAHRQQLFCARDPLGGRPLYFHEDAGRFAFASDEEALALLPGVSREPNEELVAYYLGDVRLDIDLTRSWLREVRVLRGGHRLCVGPGQPSRVQRYWQLRTARETRFGSDAECTEAFLEVFGRAVQARLRSAGPVGLMASGGLDSGAIVAMARRLPAGDLHTYSVVSDNPNRCIESQAILALTQPFGERAHRLCVPSLSGMLGRQDVLEAAWARPHPIDNSLLLPELMCMAAARAGHRVMLCGASGDVTQDVPDRYIAYDLRAGRLGSAWRECIGAHRQHTYLRGAGPLSLLAQNAWDAFVPGAVREGLRALRGSPQRNPSLMSASALALVLRSRAAPSDPPASVQAAHLSVLLSHQGVESCLTSGDRIAARYGVEFRDPWADRRVVEFFLTLPLRHKVRDGWTKPLARTAFGADMPAQISGRVTKEHLGWQLIRRTVEESPPDVLAGIVHDSLLRRHVDLNQALAQVQEWQSQRSDSACRHVYRLATLSSWLARLSSPPGNM